MNKVTLVSRLRKHWKPILAVHLFFTLAGIAVLTPLFTLLLQGALALSGNVAVMDQDIARLLLSPAGMISGILVVSILLAITGLELGALQAIAQASLNGQHVSAVAATRYSLAHALPLLRLTIGLTVRVLAYLLPYLAAVGLTGWALLTTHDINYYLSEHPPEFILAVAIAIILGAALVWLLGRRLLGWSLVLPLLLSGEATPEQTFRCSENRVAGNRAVCLRVLLSWLLLAALLTAVPFLFLEVAMGIFLGIASGKLLALALILGFVGVVWSLLNYLVAALNLAGFTFAIAHLHQEFSRDMPAGANFPQLSDGNAKTGTNWSPRRIGLAVAALLVLEMAYLLLVLHKMNVDSDVLVIAHRGAAGAAPENTRASIHRAIEDGSDWVEIDVQETRDGQVIVVHDSDFMKLAGNPLKVWDGRLEEIQQIDVGSWFSKEFSDQRVPTLADVLEQISGSDTRLVIELKYYGHDEMLEQRVVEIVEAAGMADRIAVMSLKLAGVQKLKTLRPNWTAGLLAVTAVGDITRLDVDFLAVNQSKANATFIRKAHRAGKTVYVWTVNDALSMSHWMGMGVDGIITDEPALAKDILAQRTELGTLEQLLLSTALFFGKPEALKQYRDNSP